MGILRKAAFGASLAALGAALLPLAVVAASAPAASPFAAAPRASSAAMASRKEPASVARSDHVVIRWSRSVVDRGQHPDVLGLAGLAAKNARFLRTTASGATVFKLDGRLGNEAGGVLDRLRHVPGVVSVEPDLWMTAADLPNDLYSQQLWGLLGPGDTPPSPYGLDVQAAWNQGSRGTGVTVAVVDTGRTAHPDLAGQWVGGYDFVSQDLGFDHTHDGNGWDADPTDPGDWCGSQASSWHGTHVAGTIAALAGNTIGVFGGSPGVKILPVRALGACGGYETDIADAIRWAAGGYVPGVPANAYPAKVINLSLGGEGPCVSEYASAISTARSLGAVVVVAAGNSTEDATDFTPANCPGTVTVGAIDQTGDRATFSNYGATVDVAAPGDNIISTINDSATTLDPDGYTYARYSGTSMSAPHVALTAALIAAAHPDFTPDQIETVLYATATPFPVHSAVLACVQAGCGVGIVNAGRAMTEIQSAAPVVGPVAVSPAYVAPDKSVTVTVKLVDAERLASAEVSSDGGPWVSMTASDGTFDGTFETATTTLSAPPTPGVHNVCVRARDAADPTAHMSDGTQCSTMDVDGAPPIVAPPLLNPTTAETGTPVAVTADVTDDLAVADGGVSVDGGAWSRMAAMDGQFGGAIEAVRLPVGLTAASISTDYHTCSVVSGGSLWCWGANDYGELGDGTTTFRQTPIQVPLSNVVSVSTAPWSTCALLADKTVRCWGYDSYGQLGDGGSSSQSSPVDPGLTNVSSISAGPYHTCAVLMDKTVRCWGRDDYGQLGDGATTTRRTPVPVLGLSNVVAVATGGYHTCALLGTSAVRCWGRNDRGQLGDGTVTERHSPVAVIGLSNATGLSAGNHTCAVLATGAVDCWGPNDAGQLGDDTYTDRHSPVAAAGLTGGTAVSVGFDHSCAVVSSGSVYCWGYNGQGQLGLGTDYDQYFPAQVPALSNVSAVSAGSDMTCAIVGAGAVSCWGYDLYGNLANGTLGHTLSPSPVAGFGTLNGGTHSICVRATDSAGRQSDGTACASIVVTGPPSSPANVTATRGDAQATVTWSASIAFGHPVTGYMVTSTPDGSQCSTDPATFSCPVTGLRNGTSYTFKVVATSEAGNSPPSSASNAVTPAGLPGKPVNVTGRRDDRSATVSWSAPAANGSAITSYTVTANDGTTCSTSTLSCTVTGLTNGVAYTFTVRAKNGVGTGQASDPTRQIVPAVIIARYSGPDRFSTAYDVAVKTFGSNCGCVAYVANYMAYADALSGAAAASKINGPVLLVTATGPINYHTEQALLALKPRQIVVLGGTASVSDAVFGLLKVHQPNIVRRTGVDRFEVAKNVAISTFADPDPLKSCGCTVYVANYLAYADALVASAAASKDPGPLLLVTKSGPINKYTDQALQRLHPLKIVVVGGEASVDGTAYALLAKYVATPAAITRGGGPDRYAAASNTAIQQFGSNCGCVVYVANAFAYADALAAAAAAGKVPGPVLLVSATGPINPNTVPALQTLLPQKIIVVGGPASVADVVYATLKPYAAP